MKRSKMKSVAGFTLIELVIVLGIIGILSAILIPSAFGFIRDKQMSQANANSRLVFMAVQKELNKYAYTNTTPPVGCYAKGTFSAPSTYTEGLYDSSNASVKSFDFSNVLDNDVRKGSWIAKINANQKIVEKVNWSTDTTVTFTLATIDSNSFLNSTQQDAAYKSTKQLIGCYPLGS